MCLQIKQIIKRRYAFIIAARWFLHNEHSSLNRPRAKMTQLAQTGRIFPPIIDLTLQPNVIQIVYTTFLLSQL
jgi:hypothetical protein